MFFCNEIYRFDVRIKGLFEIGAFRIFLEGYIRRWILQENRRRRIQSIGGFISIAIVGKRHFIQTAAVITAWEKALTTGGDCAKTTLSDFEAEIDKQLGTINCLSWILTSM